jgi:hypothetical protein
MDFFLGFWQLPKGENKTKKMPHFYVWFFLSVARNIEND